MTTTQVRTPHKVLEFDERSLMKFMTDPKHISEFNAMYPPEQFDRKFDMMANTVLVYVK